MLNWEEIYVYVATMVRREAIYYLLFKRLMLFLIQP